MSSPIDVEQLPDPKAMTPFVGVLIHESLSSNPNDEPLYEEEFILVFAHSQDEAREKVMRSIHDYSYENVYGETVTWRLRRLVDVAALPWDKIEDGAVLYSRHFRRIELYEKFEPLISGEEL